jgi:FixJ family two-component response regulator
MLALVQAMKAGAVEFLIRPFSGERGLQIGLALALRQAKMEIVASRQPAAGAAAVVSTNPFSAATA